MKVTAVRFALVSVLGCLVLGTALADDQQGGELGLLAGFVHTDSEFRNTSDLEPTVGLRGGVVFSRRLGWYVDALYSEIDSDNPLLEVDSISGRIGLDILFQPERHSRWFLTLGGGRMDLDVANGPDFDGPFASLGIGQRIRLGGRKRGRWELRADRLLDDDDGPNRRDVTQSMLLFGLSWGPGGSSADGDGDGVYDSRDRCPDTPRGALVDRRGCPADEDSDGVYDGVDRCAGTPAGWAVDRTGCPLDSDGDGVADGKDDCRDTPRGAVVDSRGCPGDADGDGVFDGLDRCADTPRGTQVDAAGCTRDSDGDGVDDGRDRCPDTPRGTRVDASGCARDADGDGVDDAGDKCPDTPRGTQVDAAGCPRTAPLFEDKQTTLILEGVNFETNSAELTARSTSILDRVAASLRDWPQVRVEIGGHTDSTGSDVYNRGLSTRRAESVRRYLAGKGIDAGRLVARGYGESAPIADNRTREGRARNRRVELKKQN